MTDADFTRLQERFRPKMISYLMNLCRGNWDLADDLVQEALIRAWSSRTRCHVSGNPEGWLIRIAHRIFLDHLRTMSRRPQLLEMDALGLDGTVHEYEDMAALIEDKVLTQMEISRLLSSVSWSSPGERERFVEWLHCPSDRGLGRKRTATERSQILRTRKKVVRAAGAVA